MDAGVSSARRSTDHADGDLLLLRFRAVGTRAACIGRLRQVRSAVSRQSLLLANEGGSVTRAAKTAICAACGEPAGYDCPSRADSDPSAAPPKKEGK